VSAQVPNYFEDHFLYCNISLIDTETEAVRPHLRRAFEFLNDALRVNGRVLVHCVAGVSRSVTITIAYLMYRKKLWLRDVLKLVGPMCLLHHVSVLVFDHCIAMGAQVQKKRHIAHPNDGFLLELANLELELLGASSVATVRDKIWDFVEWNKKRRKVKAAPERPKSCVVM
jgi:Dual specificity phosphatase, catalytic domain